MSTDIKQENERELVILEHVELDPDVTQATLAAKLGVAVGTVNWHMKRLVEKGYVKVKRAQRRKLHYIITPKGIAFRANLTVNYIENSMRLYRRTRSRVSDLLAEVKLAGYDRVYIHGDGDIADICRLTCLEQGISTQDYRDGDQEDSGNLNYPKLDIVGTKVYLQIEQISTTPESRSE